MTEHALSDATRQIRRAARYDALIDDGGTHANPYEARQARWGRQARGLSRATTVPDARRRCPFSQTPSLLVASQAGRSREDSQRADRVGVVIPFRYSPPVSSQGIPAAPVERNPHISTTGIAAKLWFAGTLASAPAVALGVQQVQHDAITFTLPVVAGIVCCVGGFLLVVFKLYRELETKANDAKREAREAQRRIDRLEGRK